ncbi:MAG: substrate-binding domain-containing protein [Eubacterium sp.]|nr:substrate-binding domain-containing protein [Eubacterium sp.]
MKKRLLGLVLCGIMTASLFGCGGAADSSSAGSSAAASYAAASEAASSAASEAEAESTAASSEDAAAASEASADAAADAGEMKDWEQAYVDDGYIPTGDSKYTFAFISQDFKDTFSQAVTSGIEDYVKQAYPNVELLVGDGEQDVNRQVQLAENFITQGVDVLMLSSSDSDGCVVICETARQNNVPLVVVNSDVACPEVDHFFAGSDHYYSGQLQAEYLIDNVDDSETLNLCYLGGINGFTHAKLRREGVFETLDKAGFNYNLLSDQEGKYLRDKAMEITEDWIIQYGEDIDIIVAANDEMAMGAMQSLQAAGINDVIICGIDANQDACEAVKDGSLAMTVFQDATSQGKWGAIEAYTVAETGRAPEYLDVPYLPVSAANIDEYL